MIFNKTNTDFQVKLRCLFKASVKDFMADDAFIFESLS